MNEQIKQILNRSKPCTRNPAVRVWGEGNVKDCYSQRQQCNGIEQQTQHRHNGRRTHALIRHTAGGGWPLDPNNHSIAANSAEYNKHCTNANSWLRRKPNPCKTQLTIHVYAPSHLNYIEFHITTLKFVHKLILPHSNWVIL